MKWIAFTSYSGSELLEVINKLDRVPDLIITNNAKPTVLRYWHPVTFVSDRPQPFEYQTLFDKVGTADDTLITLHGWNRIIPDEVCSHYSMLNIHPGDVVLHPELKGADPQAKAVALELPSTGVVIHRVTSELDGGHILTSSPEIDIVGMDVNQVVNILRTEGVLLWTKLLSMLLSFDNIPNVTDRAGLD